MNSFTLARSLGLLALLASAAPAQVTITPVGLTGLAAPGNANGAQFLAFDGAALNARGEVAFQARLRGLGVGFQNDTAIWAGALPPEIAAREDNRPPGTSSSVRFAILSDPVLGAGGHIAFHSGLRGLGVGAQNDAGIWAGLPATLQLAAREGAVPPGIANASVQFESLGAPDVNSSGSIAFFGTMIGLGIAEFNNAGIWAGSPGALQLVARKGSVPPGIGNASVQFLDLGTPVIGSAGAIAFNASVTGLGISEPNNTGIWTGPAGSLTLAAREGNRPPGTGFGVAYNSFDDVAINGGNQIAFGATLTGLGVSDQNNTGIWAGAPGALRVVAREGDVAPGAGNSSAWFDAFGTPTLNAAGIVAFHATLRGSVTRENHEGIWAGPIAAPALVARGGSSAPGAGDDVRFLSFGDPVFTAAGTVAFQAKLTGLGVGLDNDSGIWAADSDGQLRLLVRDGDTLDGGDIERQIRPDGLKLFPQQGGDAIVPASAVQVLFKATFIDGTNGLFIATLGAPRIESITRSEKEGVQIQFTGISGVLYAVESATDLAAGDWQVLSEPIRGTGGAVRVTDKTNPSEPARVYRVRTVSRR